jgi:L-histidine N-alpha-methyltransferase
MPNGSPAIVLARYDAPHLPAEDVGAEALAGLLAPRKMLPPKLFYDEEGCRLFAAITRLPEYYLTRTELALLPTVATEVARRLAPGAALVEYGASSERKAEIVLDALRDPVAYVPIDVAAAALADVTARLSRRRPALAVLPLAGDFLRPFDLPPTLAGRPRLGFFPGSTIGNLDPPAAVRFLGEARRTLGPGAAFLVGVDLRKDPAVLLPAYDDAQGVTAAFNLNLLRRLNREAGATFDLDAFAHRAIWNDAESRIEMHLESLRNQVVQVAGRMVRFARGETIHTENSYKYAPEAFTALARQAGWRAEAAWADSAGLFSLHLLAS